MKAEHIFSYEVKEGSLAMNYTYRGVAIRQESIITSTGAGYINYYAREGERVANGDVVYTLDETGKLNEYIQSSNMGENVLTDAELAELRNDIVNFMHGFDPINYQTTYDFKYSMKGNVLKIANAGIMQNINDLNQSNTLATMVNFCRSQNTGIVTFWTDGYEDLTPETVTKEVFDDKNYEKTSLLNNNLIATGDAVYKISTDENWSVVIPVEKEFGETLLEEEYVKVRFLKNQYESWAQVFLLHPSEDEYYAQLLFNNSMLAFATDRFVDVELILHDEKGLKIPNTAIVDKDFYLVPEDYLIIQNGHEGVLLEGFDEDGNQRTDFVETFVYNYDEDTKEYYLDCNSLKIGSYLQKLDSQEKYTVSRKASLTGVYNMNKGYADFRQIHILYQNEEYSIVKSNTQYGLNVYDYIVLDAKSVESNQLFH